MNEIKPIEEFAQYDTEVAVTMIITMNDEPIATMDVGIPPKEPGRHDDGMTFDTDSVIEDLGKIERHVFPAELQKRYDRYVEEIKNKLESEG